MHNTQTLLGNCAFSQSQKDVASVLAQGWGDSKQKIADAAASVDALRTYRNAQQGRRCKGRRCCTLGGSVMSELWLAPWGAKMAVPPEIER